MAQLLLVVMLASFIFLGLVAKEFNWVSWAILLVLTFGLPAGFYLLF
jgi:hypothetical protein